MMKLILLALIIGCITAAVYAFVLCYDEFELSLLISGISLLLSSYSLGINLMMEIETGRYYE